VTATDAQHERPADVDPAPAAGALLAVGVGTLVIGILTTWAEASTGFADALNWKDRVGPLSGKTIVGVLAYFASWAVLTVALRGRTPVLQPHSGSPGSSSASDCSARSRPSSKPSPRTSGPSSQARRASVSAFRTANAFQSLLKYA
jgi:hypothetical protein